MGRSPVNLNMLSVLYWTDDHDTAVLAPLADAEKGKQGSNGRSQANCDATENVFDWR
jgi:hypothetical protein